MSNSKLVSYTMISPNRNSPRNHKIDKITIHHMAGNLTIEQCGAVFAPTSRQASSNYGIGSDGRIALYVDESDRSWCSSNAENDHRAVTIEVANSCSAEDGERLGWPVSDKAMNAIIDLCVDICQRNGIKRLNYTGDKSGNLTMHKWFAPTGCPGPYLSGKFPYIANEVNKRLDGKVSESKSTFSTTKTSANSKFLTYEEFEKKYLGKAVDYDGVLGVQCVDLADQYLKDCYGITGVWCNGARDLYTNFDSYAALKNRFTKIANTRELVVRKGDLVVWSNGDNGHIAIGNGEGTIDWFVSLEENTLNRHEPTQLVRHDFGGVLGVLRPKEMSVANSPKTKTAKTRGVDISEYQGTPDFAKLKNAVDFVIIKAGYGRYRNQVDPQFERNYSECKKYGIPCGAYWFGYATNPQDAASEARICAEVLKGKKFEYPIYYDMETDTQSNHYPFNTGIDNCSAMVEAFCSTLESYGYFAGMYISRSPLQQYIYPETAAKYSLWIAEYGGKCNYTGTYGMWQYSDNGSVSGIAKAVDLDECYVDYPKIVKEGGFNGYPEALKELDKPSEAWWKHGDKLDHGLYAAKARMKSLGYGYLDLAGGFGGGTEKAVNDLLRLWGYKQNGVIGKNFVDIVMK